jgi:hypothetical protein
MRTAALYLVFFPVFLALFISLQNKSKELKKLAGADPMF